MLRARSNTTLRSATYNERLRRTRLSDVLVGKTQARERDESLSLLRNAATREPDAPCAGIGPALQRLLAEGVNPQDLTDVVRVMQYELLFGLC